MPIRAGKVLCTGVIEGLSGGRLIVAAQASKVLRARLNENFASGTERQALRVEFGANRRESAYTHADADGAGSGTRK